MTTCVAAAFAPCAAADGAHAYSLAGTYALIHSEKPLCLKAALPLADKHAGNRTGLILLVRHGHAMHGSMHSMHSAACGHAADDGCPAQPTIWAPEKNCGSDVAQPSCTDHFTGDLEHALGV
eukprot:jgi/Ulvmu1/8466/UM043_0046.1